MLSRFARVVNAFCATPQATVAAFLFVAIWLAFGPINHWSDSYQLILNSVTTIVTFLMVFVLNMAQSRDTGAISVKLDAIILATEAADNRIVGLEHKSDDEAKDLRERLAHDAGN
jgi:low affinity Fe/Cu permease